MAKRVAVIAGATGAAAKRLVEVLLADPEWTVVGLCRNPPPQTQDKARERLSYLACNLTDSASTRAALARVPQATHLFYTARMPFSDATAGVEDVPGNRAMLANLLDGAEAAASGLEHVHLVRDANWLDALASSRGRPAPHAAEFLLCPAGSPELARRRQALDMVGITPRLSLRLCARAAAQPRAADRRLGGNVRGVPDAAGFSR